MALNPYANPFIPRRYRQPFVQGETLRPNEPMNLPQTPASSSPPVRSGPITAPKPFLIGQQISAMFAQIQEEERNKKLKSEFPAMKNVVNRHVMPESILKGITYPITGSFTNHAINAGTSLIGGAVKGVHDLINRPQQENLQAANRLAQEKFETRQNMMSSQSQGRFVSYR